MPATPEYATELAMLVERVAQSLLALPEEVAARRPAPGKWSAKEIVGHLVDSASNNHGRFVRAQWTDDLVCPTYDQDAWVASQRYQEAPWPQLVALLREMNRQIARVMVAIPERDRLRPRARHNLGEIAFRPVPPDVPATLDWFMRDYVDHFKHHLRQLVAATGRAIA